MVNKRALLLDAWGEAYGKKSLVDLLTFVTRNYMESIVLPCRIMTAHCKVSSFTHNSEATNNSASTIVLIINK